MELMQIYSVPVWRSEYPEFEENKETLLAKAREYREQNPTTEVKSNVAGYHSPGKFQMVGEFGSVFEHICELGMKAAFDLNFVDCDLAITEAWLNVNDNRQCMNTEHVHNEVFSGVFYLKAPKGSGNLVLPNPSLNRLWKGISLVDRKNQFTGERIKIEPKEGSVILFPSYLPHSVETNDHDEERISISFNLIAFPKGFLQRPQQ